MHIKNVPKVSAVTMSRQLRDVFTTPSIGFAGMAEYDWRPTHRTLRIAATAERQWFAWKDCGSTDLVSGNCTSPSLRRFNDCPTLSVSLVVLAKRHDADLRALLVRYAKSFDDIIVVLDRQNRSQYSAEGVTFVGRPLAGDFAAQRNFGNRNALGDWVFHLDTDEHVSDAFIADLSRLAGIAQTAGLNVVGFPRRNHVDRQLSDLFPDIQYRLMRRDVRYEGNVHERPIPGRKGTTTIVSQHGAIDHYLQRHRVSERSALYDGLGQEPERHADNDALLRPFAP